MPSPTVLSRCLVWFILPLLWLAAGCRPPSDNSQPDFDPINTAIRDAAEAAEKRFLESSRPILLALQNRDYSALYDFMSPYALRYCSGEQFTPNSNPQPLATLNNSSAEGMTREAFLEAMQAMESQLGQPMILDMVYVQTIDPEELAGKSDGLSNAFNIGAMSKEIPFEIRRASLRAQLKCRPNAELAQAIADEFKLPVADIQSGKIPESPEFDRDMLHYLTFKYVLVEEANQLKIGYFEFLPASMLD